MLAQGRAALRNRLSQSQRSLARRSYNVVWDSISITPMLSVLKLFPPSHRARIKERMRPIGRLDYGPGEIKMNLDGSLQVMRLRSCRKEPETVRWIERYMVKGDVLYDVGANVGPYSLVAAASLNGDCEIYAIEPSFSTFSALSANVLLNNLSLVIKPLHVALSSSTTLATFHYSDTSAGAALHAVEEPIDQAGGCFTAVHSQPVLTYRLDDLIATFSLPCPNHLKIDTDGAELRVLQGAKNTLMRSELRSLFVEVNERLDSCSLMLDLLSSHGFKVVERHPAGVSPGFFNCVFVRDS